MALFHLCGTQLVLDPGQSDEDARAMTIPAHLDMRVKKNTHRSLVEDARMTISDDMSLPLLSLEIHVELTL